jgi:hypothetical protein
MKDMTALWIVGPTNLFFFFVFSQTNGTGSRIGFIVVVQQKVGFLSPTGIAAANNAAAVLVVPFIRFLVIPFGRGLGRTALCSHNLLLGIWQT